ncbi:MAG: hypothetical protein EOP62_13215 [Sphingomonadales bacterium]|nr:MAG: hypothetical protein EOP62_13215 [Sphingomonadales bacterium]
MSPNKIRFGILFAVWVSLSSPAFAYLDGATGAIIVQSIVAGVTTWLVFSRMAMMKVKEAVRRVFGKRSDSDPE